MGYTIWPDGDIGNILRDIYQERLNQDELKRKGKFPFVCADKEISHEQNYTVLGEEFGEVGHVLNEAVGSRIFDIQQLRKELIQVAAVAVAWLEKVEAEMREQERIEKKLTKL